VDATTNLTDATTNVTNATTTLREREAYGSTWSSFVPTITTVLMLFHAAEYALQYRSMNKKKKIVGAMVQLDDNGKDQYSSSEP
jgi:hypothetical protein